MASKVRYDRGAWWVFTHHQGKRKKKRVGPTKADKRRAEKIAEKINAAIALGSFSTAPEDDTRALPCDAELRRWHATYAPTMKPTYAKLTEGLIENHLVPYFGSTDLREIRESDLLGFVQRMQASGRAPGTIQNALSALRRVCSLLVREKVMTTNPATGIGKIVNQIQRASAAETKEVEAWSHAEAEILLRVAAEAEPRFAPFLRVLLSTGMRRGEALGLKWSDIDLDAGYLTIRRSITLGGISTPKSGKARRIRLSPALAETLFDLLGERRRQCIAKGWREVPEWVFCSEVGTAWGPRNVIRIWERVRRRAHKEGVRPLKLHCARHTWATLALRAGKSVRWVADQLGHADPSMTLNVYAHAMPEEEADLSFADFAGQQAGHVFGSEAASNAPRRPYTAPASITTPEQENAASPSDRQRYEIMERETGIEPATLSLGIRAATSKGALVALYSS
jgi:integrase